MEEVILTQEEAQALLILLGRVSINGAEAEAFVQLKAKLASQLVRKEEPKAKEEK